MTCRLYSLQRLVASCTSALALICLTTALAQSQSVTERVVLFRNADASISGTLVQPTKVLAAAVIVHGSGQEKRMLPFAREIADLGIAALTYDKRGVGESTGTYTGPEVGTNNVDAANLKLLAGDAAAAVGELVRNLPSKRQRIGLIGFSQAGWIIPLACRANPEIKFLILFSGPVVSTHEQLRFQNLTQQRTDFWEQHSETEVRDRIEAPPDLFQFPDTDPRDSLEHLSIPGLWMFGGHDLSVPVGLSVYRLKPLIEQGKPFEYHVFPASAHSLDEREAVPFMIEWLRRRMPP